MHFSCFHILNGLSWKLESQKTKKEENYKQIPEVGNGAILATGGDK